MCFMISHMFCLLRARAYTISIFIIFIFIITFTIVHLRGLKYEKQIKKKDIQS